MVGPGRSISRSSPKPPSAATAAAPPRNEAGAASRSQRGPGVAPPAPASRPASIAPSAPPSAREDQQRRPEQVELLLDGQGPDMGQEAAEDRRGRPPIHGQVLRERQG